ncbi:type VII secretion protein EccE [Crossiella cryophila]|uniref:Type VII secretion protein EccE n=1 Tax=Crossiella cryophila TaxID=43355 RepID=A0A7W7CDJ9_9PSEU|nr:type VII secretion protein EccE [Crossiella cryophila]MBB4679067.1 type VII secretion protein EccE [Crossiella cryophila]
MSDLSTGRRGRVVPLGAGTIAVVEIAALAVLATAVPFGPVSIAAITVATLALAVTLLRFRGLPPYRWAALYLRFLRRRPRLAAREAATPLRALLPDLSVHTQVDRAGNRVGVASVEADASFCTMVRIAPAAHPTPDALIRLLREVYERSDIRLSSAQLVVWALPGLPARTGAATPIRVHWLSLRYRPAEAPLAALARGGGQEGSRRAVASAAHRLVSRLAEAGYPATVLDTLELHQELLVAVGADPEVVSGPLAHDGTARHRVTETWRDVSVGRLRQACFVPKDPADAIALLGRCAPEAMFTCTSYTLSRTARGDLVAQARARVGVAAGGLWLSPQRASQSLGVPVVPVDGRQDEHTIATLPLALTP